VTTIDVPILDYAPPRRRRGPIPLWLDILLFIFWMLLTNAFFLSLMVVMTYGIFLILRP